MKAYYILDIMEMKDQGLFSRFSDALKAAAESHQGRLIVRGGKITPLAGGWQPERFIIIEFPSGNEAQAFLESGELRELSDLRRQSAESRSIIVEGM